MENVNEEIGQALVNLRADMLRFARGWMDRAAAEDVVQAACVRALEKAHRFQPGTNVRAWLFRLLRNEAVDAVRAGRRFVALDADGRERAGAAVGPREVDPWTMRRLVEGGARVGMTQADVLRFAWASWVEDCTLEETAETMGIPRGTVMSRRWRLIRELRG